MTSEASPLIEETDTKQNFMSLGLSKLKSAIFSSDIKELELVVSRSQDKMMKRKEEKEKKAKQLDTALKEKNLTAIRDLIHEKVAQEDNPDKVTCHLNDKLDRSNYGEVKASEYPKTRGIQEVKEKIVDIKERIVEIGHEMEMLDDEDVSFIDEFFRRDYKNRWISVSRNEFDGNQDIVSKLKSLMSDEWTEKELRSTERDLKSKKELRCFFRIFLTAAAREKRHDMVDVMLHMIRDQGGNPIME